MYFPAWVLSIGFSWLIAGLMVDNVAGKGVRAVNKKFSTLTHDDRYSHSNGGYNDNYQHNNGYDYMGNSGNLGSRDSNYDNYGISQSSRNNYDGYGNSRKSDFRYVGGTSSNSNMHRDQDTSLYSARSGQYSDGYGDHSNHGWNSYDNI